MKNLLTIAIIAFFGISTIFACGGMSPAPAPADTNVTVPDLPSDSTPDVGTNPTSDLPNGGTTDTTTCTGDNVNNPVDTGKTLEDTTTGDLNDLSSDLPQDNSGQNSPDGTFVATVL